MISKILAFRMSILALALSFNAIAVTAQQVDSTSDASALAVVEKSILAMGGRATWRSFGAATVNAQITPERGPERHVAWSDDWSTGRVRFRRDAVDVQAKHAYIVGSDETQIHKKPDGTPEQLKQDHGIAVLALGYPAPALILSTLKYHCVFHFDQKSGPEVNQAPADTNTIVIAERCPHPVSSAGAATIMWTFSKSTGLPTQVVLPIQGLKTNVIRSQTVIYNTFRSVQGALTPLSLSIRRVSGSVDKVTFDSPVFLDGLSDQTFTTSNQ